MAFEYRSGMRMPARFGVDSGTAAITVGMALTITDASTDGYVKDCDAAEAVLGIAMEAGEGLHEPESHALFRRPTPANSGEEARESLGVRILFGPRSQQRNALDGRDPAGLRGERSAIPFR